MSIIVIQASPTLNSFQVLAYSLGLGTLVQNETRLRLHMRAELVHNDSPYGLLVLTGGHPDVHVHLCSVMSSFAAHRATLIYSVHLLCVHVCSISYCTENIIHIAAIYPPFPKWAPIRWLFCESLESVVTLDQMWALEPMLIPDAANEQQNALTCHVFRLWYCMVSDVVF